MHITDLEMYDILKEKMSDKDARDFLKYIESKVEDKFVDAYSVFSTKEDLLKLELKIVQVITDSKTETLKWMLVFITTSTIAIIGTILTVMKILGW